MENRPLSIREFVLKYFDHVTPAPATPVGYITSPQPAEAKYDTRDSRKAS